MIARETLVEQSVEEFVKDQLFNVREYPETAVGILDQFPTEDHRKSQPLDKTYIAMGFHFDQGGLQAECGSDLKTRVYVLEFWVFGKSQGWAKNVASAIRDGADSGGTIPLLDLSVAEHPILDRMVVIITNARREAVQDPNPWEENVWSVTVQVQDEYYANLV